MGGEVKRHTLLTVKVLPNYKLWIKFSDQTEGESGLSRPFFVVV